MKKLILFIFSLVFVLAGCGTLEVELEKDGSGTFKYEFEEEEEFYTAEDIENELESTIESQNDSYGEEVVSLKKISSKDGVTTAVIEFTSAAASNDSLFMVPVEDMVRYNPAIIDSLVDIDGELIDLEDEKVKDLTAVRFEGLDALEATVKVPGEIKYFSSNDSLVKGSDDTLSLEGTSTTIVYEESGMNFLPLLIIVIILAVAATAIVIFKNKKGSTDSVLTVAGGDSINA